MIFSDNEIESLIKKIQNFLETHGWEIASTNNKKIIFYSPPNSLGIEGNYSVGIPQDLTSESSIRVLNSTANSLAQVYGYTKVGDLLDEASNVNNDSTPIKLTSRLIDESTYEGSIPLMQLTAFLGNLSVGIERGVKFKLESDSKASSEIAHDLLKQCYFLQTSHGSFITSIEVPNLLLKQSGLLGDRGLSSNEVMSSIFSSISFLNEKVARNNIDYESPDFLGDVTALFDVELLGSLVKVILDSDVYEIEFSLESGAGVRVTTTGPLTTNVRNNYVNFYKYVRDLLREDDDISVSGPIVELRSKDPEGDNNYIKIEADYFGDKCYITASLNNDDYKIALHAHEAKRKVYISGKGVRLKTHIRIKEIKSFSI